MPFLSPLPDWLSAERAARALAHRPGLVWLDGDGRPPLGTRSFVASDPVEELVVPLSDPDPFAALDLMGPECTPAHAPTAQVPRWVGWIAYDAAWSARRGARHRRAATDPALWFGRYDAMACFQPGHAPWIVADGPEAAHRLLARLLSPPPPLPPIGLRTAPRVAPSEWAHQDAVRAVVEAIAEGEVYQVNLARRWTARLAGHPLALFLRMRRASPVPLGALMPGPDRRWLLARTMERFIAWNRASGEIESRPIKGTIPWPGATDAAARLRNDPKERAEHAMIVDLMRNDLARVCNPGSVRVADWLRVEPYARLAHLVSVVRGTARPGTRPSDLLKGTFPPASVTGCPKEAAIEHIERIEPSARGPYTGALGYMDRAGGLSLAVAIRVAVLRGDGLEYHAGGGIVYDSDPRREVAETTLKARALLDALPPSSPNPGDCAEGGEASH